MLEGVNKILAVTTDAQKITAIGQIDAANKRLRTFKTELEKLTGHKGDAATESSEEYEAMQLLKELDAQLQDEMKKKEALSKLAAADKKKKTLEPGKDIEIEILVSERLIAKCKEGIETLKSVRPYLYRTISKRKEN